MGLWVQNVGVLSESIPACVRVKADAEGHWLPSPSAAGWSWVSLREMTSFEDLDALTVGAATEAGSAAIAFSVHDEDSVYVVGGDAGGVAFRLVMSPRDFDAQDLGVSSRAFGSGGPGDFAKWTERWAPRSVSASSVRRLRREAAIHSLLQAAGLYPPPRSREPWEGWYPKDMRRSGGMEWTQPLVGQRLYAVLEQPPVKFEGPPGPWIVLIAHVMGVRMGSFDWVAQGNTVSWEELPAHIEQLTARIEEFLAPVVRPMVICPTVNAVFSPDPKQFATVVDAVHYYEPRYCGRLVAGWQEVPNAVEHDQAATVAWLVETTTGRSVDEWVEAVHRRGDESQGHSSGS